MKKKINSWLTRIDRISALFKSEFGSLNSDELNWKPNEQVWSIAQVIDHLIITTKSYFPVFESILSEKYILPLTARIPGFPNLIGRLVLKSVHPDNRKKTKSLPVWLPSKGTLPVDIVQQFLSNQRELKELIINSESLLINNFIISSPANKYIVYSIENAFEILVSHQERHFIQADEIKQLQKASFQV